MLRRVLMLGLVLLPGTALAADAAAGAKIAAVKCTGCHGEGGAGNGPLLTSLGVTTPPVPWTNKAQMAAFSDAEITKIIEGGGKALDKPPIMPPFGKQLSEAQVADLVAYVRSLGK
jgi:high-affinity iron transporter